MPGGLASWRLQTKIVLHNALMFAGPGLEALAWCLIMCFSYHIFISFVGMAISHLQYLRRQCQIARPVAPASWLQPTDVTSPAHPGLA